MPELDEERVMRCVQDMIDSGATSNSIQMALNVGVNNVGKRFEKGNYFIAGLIVSEMPCGC